MRLLQANETALHYWRIRGYSAEELENFLCSVDGERLAARVTFQAGLSPVVTISKRAWEVQSGHYGTILHFFEEVAQHPIGRKLSGSIGLWLEDGALGYENQRFMSAPVFCFGRTMFDTCSLIMPDPAFLESFGYRSELAEQQKFEDQIPFSERAKSVFWRGAASGLGFTPSGWKESPRGKLVLKAKALNNPSMLDACFSKVPSWTPETVKSINESGVVGKHVDFLDFLKHRYLVDADGIACAWISLYRKLASKSVVVKMASENVQWYYHLMKPWVHYVPLRANAEDIEIVYEWLNRHPDECQKIARNANDLIESIRYEDEVEQVITLISTILTFQRKE